MIQTWRCPKCKFSVSGSDDDEEIDAMAEAVVKHFVRHEPTLGEALNAVQQKWERKDA